MTVNIAILGLGSMGRAILAGLLNPEHQSRFQVAVTNNSAAKAAEFDNVNQVTAFATESNPSANSEAVADADIVLVAVKPWQILELLNEVAPALKPGAIVVSVAAGITTSVLEGALPEHVSVFRAMPNTPSLVGKGVTGLVRGSRASDTDLEQARMLFDTVGAVVVLEKEHQIDALGAVSGSGPAYVFYFIEKFIESALALGFTNEEAHTLVLGTFSGAVELLERSGEEPAELRRRVTSPKGTTEQAIRVFDESDLSGIFDRALSAAMTRSAELARENS